MSQAVSSSFLSRLRASNVLAAEQLDKALAAVGEDEKEVADYLLRAGQLTRFQVRQLRAGSTSLTLGNYVVLDCLGRGGNGIVFKARNRLMPDRYVALKTIDTRLLQVTEDVAARFKREIEIVSRLDHPNVVRAVDVIKTRSFMYLVLELIDGHDLAALVKERGPLPIGEAVDYGVQAARGLAYAHSLGIVHRDLKPSNLLLTREGVVKITDLGLARFFVDDHETNLTKQGLAMGTPEFMAPEQAEDARAADPRSDLYSLGATLFHLITGTLPIGGTSYLHKLQQLLTLRPRPLAEARGDVPPGLAEVVDRLRARAPAERPSSAEETIALLEPYANRPATALTPPPARMDVKQMMGLVLELLRGQADAATLASKHGLTALELDTHKQRFLDAGAAALAGQAPTGQHEAEKRELHAKIGAQAMEIESLRKRLHARR